MSQFTKLELRILQSGLDHVFDDYTSSEFEEVFGVMKEDMGYIGEKLAKMLGEIKDEGK